MTPVEFLKSVWPSSGLFALALPYVLPDLSKTVYRHAVFTTIEGAEAFIERHKHKHDLYFCMHALRDEKRWNPNKKNLKTGETGAFEVRTQANMLEARVFFFDLDVGVSDERSTKYQSQAEALAGLKNFCTQTGLPKPTITSSGGGLHVYWPISEALPSENWKEHAHRLRQLAKHYGLLADPTRITDSASVLRVPGTFNHKNPANPRPVRVLNIGKETPNGVFLKLVADAMTRADIQIKAMPKLPAGDLLGSNLEREFDAPPVAMRALVAACGQVQRLVKLRGNVSEPEWYHTLNLVRFVERGDHYAHKMSAGHPTYSFEGTQAKLEQLRDRRNGDGKPLGPTTCNKLAEVCGDEACVTCPFAGKVKSPLQAARYKDEAPAPVVEVTLGPQVITTEIPSPPEPYMRMKGGGIAVATKDKEGNEHHIRIYANDLYPIRRLVNTTQELEQQTWRVHLPRSGAKDFALDADALYDRKKFLTTISHQGIYPEANQVNYLQEYMIAYIQKLQQEADAEAQCNHLGWTDSCTNFIMPDKIMLEDGTARPAALSLGAQRASQQVFKKGTLQRQVELLRFYEHPDYTPNQFFILNALAAPLFYMTGHHGVIVNATGDAGASKSTSLYTAASFWGQPELYPINGTNNGATVRGRNERVTTLANLPICVDEITHMPIKDAQDLAMGITQPGHRIRLEQSGVERASNDAYKATIMLTTANSSLHTLLSTDNSAGTAGSMRVFEIPFRPLNVHTKPEADEFLHELRENFGHVGEAFMGYVVRHRKAVEKRLREVMREIDTEGRIQSSERFWSAAIAAVLVAAEIAKSLGLLNYDAARLKQWALTVQLDYMRGTVREEYASPLGVLADYLELIAGDMIVTHRPQAGGNITPVAKSPRGQLLAHYEIDDGVMFVLKKGFKDYCNRIGANSRKILDELHQPRPNGDKAMCIVTSKLTKKVLGYRTEFAKAQTACFVIDMAHVEVSGSLKLIEGNPEAKPTTKPSLRAV